MTRSHIIGPPIEMDEKHTVRKIVVKPENIYVTEMDHDSVITVKIGGEQFQAMVPTHSLYEEDGVRFVPAEQIGRIGDKLILVLPPSNDGTPCWHVREEDLAKVLVP